MALVLGLDTSNYTTSAAVYDTQAGEITQNKQLLPVKKGEVGLRQSDAVFHHTQQLPILLEQLLSGVTQTITAIGVSERPRPVEGSYMPCFTVGTGTGRALAAALGVPLFAFSHQEGHIAAALYGAKQTRLLQSPFLAFHVSGGTTEALLVKPKGGNMSIQCVGQTLDLNAGQAVDRIGVLLGMSFPCGKQLEQLVLQHNGELDGNLLRSAKPSIKGNNCCLSGLENKCRTMYEAGASKEETAGFCLAYIYNTLLAMTRNIVSQYGSMPVVFAGGVMSNTLIRRAMEQQMECYFAPPEFSSDNSAGTAWLAAKKHEKTQ